MVINENTINAIYNKLLRKINAYVTIDTWCVKPRNLKLSNSKRAYGLAYQNGDVAINKAFIGTESVDKLKYTITHEFTHLIVGLHNNHNVIFQRMLSNLLRVLKISDHGHDYDVASNIKHKYNLTAMMDDGSFVDCGMYNKKHKRYTGYSGYGMSIKGVRVVKFVYNEINHD